MRIHPRQILWPTDFSALSLHAAPYARAFCETFNANLHVIYVAIPISPDNAAAPFMTGGQPLATTANTIEEMEEALRLLTKRRFASITAISRLIVGHPWQEICQYAKREDIDLIILATHGATGLKHLLMGSTAERVVQHAPCPVLTVKCFERDLLENEPASSREKTIPSTASEYEVTSGPA